MQKIQSLIGRCYTYLGVRMVVGLIFALFGIGLNQITVPVNSQVSTQTKLILNIQEALILTPPTLVLESKPNTTEFIFNLGPLKLVDGTILRNTKSQLIITLEGETTPLIIEGNTNNQGLLIIDTSLSLQAQGYTLIQGTQTQYTNLETSQKIVEAYGIGFYTTQQQNSNKVDYSPPEPPKPEPEPEPKPKPEEPKPTPPPRTGGSSLQIQLSLVGGTLLIAIIIFLRTRKKKITQKRTLS